MAPNLMLEIKVVQRFVDESKQDGYVQVLASIKTRHQFIDALTSFSDFRLDALETVTGDDIQFVLAELSQHGIDVTKCYIISQDPDIDTEIIDIEPAVSMVASSSTAAILVFGNAEMIYFKDRGGNRYISN